MIYKGEEGRKMQMFKKLACLAYVSFASVAYLGGAIEPMASQKWVKMTVSNETVNTKAWVKDYVGNTQYGYEDLPAPDLERDAWYDGTNLCFKSKVNGRIVRSPVVRYDFAVPRDGLQVIDCINPAPGSATNGMFYTNLGDGRFYCSSCENMMYISYAGIVTQNVEGVTNIYTKYVAEEKVNANGGYYYVTWESQQIGSQTWRMFYVDSQGENYREITLFMTTGVSDTSAPTYALYSCPIETPSMGFWEFVSALLCPPCYAIDGGKAQVGGFTGSFTLKYLDNIIEFPLIYHGPPGVIREDETEEERVGDEIVTTIYRWSPNPYPEEADFKNYVNWMEDSYSFTIQFQDVETGQTVSEKVTLPLATVMRICGQQIRSAIESAYVSPTRKKVDEERSTDCDPKTSSAKGHFTPDDSCRCRRCGKDRGHDLQDNPDDPLDCRLCVNHRGYWWAAGEGRGNAQAWEQLCGGRNNASDEGHRGWHPQPSNPLNEPPGSNGDYWTCVCKCETRKLTHEFTENKTSAIAGDVFGDLKNEYHHYSIKCDRCEGDSQFSDFGWKAVSEVHKLDNDGITGEVRPVVCGGATLEDICAPDDPGVDKEYHLGIGECKVCHENVNGRLRHTFSTSNCKCECGVVNHTWRTGTCQHYAECIICGKSYYRDDDGVHLDMEDLGYHEFGVPIQKGDYFDMENHKCKCYKKVLRQHNWVEITDPDSGEKNWECQDIEELGIVWGGCHLLKHDEANCPEDQALGDCTFWYCPICGKDLTGRAAKNYHGSYAEGKESYGYSTRWNGERNCALCNHKLLGTRCGTYRDQNTHEHVYIGVEIPDWRCHSGWRHIDDFKHICRCDKKVDRDHNWNAKSCTDKNERQHEIREKCDKQDGGQPLPDNCGHEITYTEGHNWYENKNPSTGARYFRNYNGKCQKQYICRTYIGGDDAGCHRTKWEDSAHDWHFLSWFGISDIYQCGTGENFEKCYMCEQCEHANLGGVPEGCGAKRFEYSTNHRKDYYESTPIDGEMRLMRHRTNVRCLNECGYYVVLTNGHNLTDTWKPSLWSLDEHEHFLNHMCNKDYMENPHCGLDWSEEPVVGYPSNSYSFDDNIFHTKHRHCSKCEGDWSGQEVHDGYYDIYWDEYVPIDETEHSRSNYCNRCEETYGGTQRHYVTSENWEMVNQPDEETVTFDLGTCYFCGMVNEYPHECRAIIAYLPSGMKVSDKHGCWHTQVVPGVGPCDSPNHMEQAHSGVPCTYCGYEGDDSPDQCKCCGCKQGESCLYGVNMGVCQCAYCLGNDQDSNECYCSDWRRYLKFTAPIIWEEEFMRVFINNGAITVDAVDPVYEVRRSGFEEAFMSSDVQSVDFGALTNAYERAFMNAFKECSSLSYVNFSALQRAEAKSFSGAFEQTSLTSINLGSLLVAEDDAFDGAFAGDGAWIEVSIPKISDIGVRAFANNNLIRELSLPCVTNIGEYAFANCTNLWLFDFRGTTNIPYLASANAFTNVAEDSCIIVDDEVYDAWRSATNWSDIAEMIVSIRGYDTNCDIYVSSVFGNDSFDGLSPERPKRTLEAAVAMATNKTVGVMFGDYETPEYFNKTSGWSSGTPYPVYIVGLDDKRLVRLHGHGRIVGSGLNDGKPKTSFENVTISHSRRTETTSTSHYFLYCIFYNCIFKDCDTRPNNSPLWEASIVEDCLVKNFSISPVGGNGGGYYYNPHVFFGCMVYNSIMNFTNTDKGNLVFQCESDFENCYISGGKFDNLQSYYPGQYQPPQGAAFYDCTIIPESVNYVNTFPGYGSPPTYGGFTPVATNCIIGVDGQTNNPPWQTECICTNRATAIEAIDPNTLMPKSEYEDWQGHGYKRLPEALLAPKSKNEVKRWKPHKIRDGFEFKVAPEHEED